MAFSWWSADYIVTIQFSILLVAGYFVIYIHTLHAYLPNFAFCRHPIFTDFQKFHPFCLEPPVLLLYFQTISFRMRKAGRFCVSKVYLFLLFKFMRKIQGFIVSSTFHTVKLYGKQNGICGIGYNVRFSFFESVNLPRLGLQFMFIKRRETERNTDKFFLHFIPFHSFLLDSHS